MGSVCYGHITGVTEDYAETFVDHWIYGNAVITLTGDDEIISFGSGQYRESKPWKTGAGTFKVQIDKYQTGTGGSPSSIEYKEGATSSACEADSWHTYSDGVGLVSTGWIKLKITA